MTDAATIRVECPRCGYDLRGAIDSWKQSCPLDGRCAECGYGFQWGALISMKRRTLPWCVEHVAGRSLPCGIIGTMARSCRPWRFWSELQPAHHHRFSRIALYIIALLIVPLLPWYIVTQTTLALLVRSDMQVIRAFYTSQTPNWMQHYTSQRNQWTMVRDYDVARSYEGNLPGVGHVGFIARDAGSAEQWAELWQVYDQQFAATIATYQNRIDNDPQVRHSYHAAVTEAILRPLAYDSDGILDWSDGHPAFYPGPGRLYGHWLYSRGATSSIWAAEGWREELILVMAFTQAAVAVYLIAMPLSFILLPITRRRAKVRWRHFVRISGYGFLIPIAIFWIGALSISLSMLLPTRAEFLLNLARYAAIILPLPTLGVWWFFAIRNYLKLPHAFWLVVLMSLVTLLAILMVTTLPGTFRF